MNWDEKVCHAAQFVDHDPDVIGDSEYADGYVDGAVSGAHWMRDQLRTDEAIERVARGILYSEFPGDKENCDYHWTFFSDHYLKQARTAITALLGEEPCHR